jgi:hypothetical protein
MVLWPLFASSHTINLHCMNQFTSSAFFVIPPALPYLSSFYALISFPSLHGNDNLTSAHYRANRSIQPQETQRIHCPSQYNSLTRSCFPIFATQTRSQSRHNNPGFLMPQSRKQTCRCVPLKWSFGSKAVEGFIDLIVGKGMPSIQLYFTSSSLKFDKELADQRDIARYERDMSSAEAHNKAVKRIVHESPPPADPLRSE